MKEKKIRCDQCIFRTTRYEEHRCNYYFVTGETRQAQPPEECTFFREGERMEKGEFQFLQDVLAEKAQRKPGSGAKEKHDWELARRLYDKGYNDGEISRAMGVNPQTVCGWRKRNQLPARTKSGGRRKASDWT